MEEETKKRKTKEKRIGKSYPNIFKKLPPVLFVYVGCIVREETESSVFLFPSLTASFLVFYVGRTRLSSW